jgi:adenylyl cyclase-associated protein
MNTQWDLISIQMVLLHGTLCFQIAEFILLKLNKLTHQQPVNWFVSLEHVETAPSQPLPQKVAKVPKKELQGLNWLVANISNENVDLPAGQVQMKQGIFIENCKDCVISILDKFKSLQMNNCSNATLVVGSCVSGVEVMNGENLEIRVKGHSPSVSIDNCKRVRLVLNEDFLNTDIVTSKIS